VAILDPERADLLEAHVPAIKAQAGTTCFFVWEHHEGKGNWKGMRHWSEALASVDESAQRHILDHDPSLAPEDNATIFFTSGT